jgi:hypothetical protein
MIDSIAISHQVISILEQLADLRRPKITPSASALAQVIEKVFWASLDRYEGIPLRTRVFFTPRQALTSSSGIICFENRQAFSLTTIRQLSPALAAGGGLLVVEDERQALWIEGILGCSPSITGSSPLWLSVECCDVGVVRVKNSSSPILEFSRGVVRQLGGMSFDRNSAEVLLMSASLFPDEPAGRAWHIASAIIDIAFAIERTGGGGALWILPSTSSSSSEVRGLGQVVRMHSNSWEPYREMWELRTSTIRLLNQGCNAGHEFLQAAAQEWDSLRRNSLIDTVASLAGIDGAILLDGSPQVLEFGVICNQFAVPATTVQELTDPGSPTVGSDVEASYFGGSRHRSAIDFCSSNYPAGAVVASHDGGLTVFVSLSPGKVIGSRISLIQSDSEVS